jgi:hypothetical protein
MVLGLVLVGGGIIAQSWAWAAPGVVVLIIGGVLGLYGGFFYDVRNGASAKAQLRDVVEGNEHEFPGADTTRSEAEVVEDVHRRWLHDQ